jgi:hypothetical protein
MVPAGNAMSGPDAPPIPQHIVLCRFGRLGFWITVQCPPEFDALMLEAGAVWESGGRRWLLRLHRLGPVLRALRRSCPGWWCRSCG